MDRRLTLQWIGHVLRMDEDRLPRQVFDCSLARATETLKTFLGCTALQSEGHEEGSGGGATFRDFLKLPSHTKLISWPGIRAAVAVRALDRQARRGTVKNLAPLEVKKPQQAGRMTRSCDRRGRSC
eukprot:361040-Chlamydomonas_euryale.AAC.7